MTTEVNINISKLEVLESNGFLLQGLQFMDSLVQLFSINTSLTIDQDSVCAIVLLDQGGHPVAASVALRYDSGNNKIINN